MRWSWRIGRLAGIDLYIHWTFLLLVAWFLLLPLLQTETRSEAAAVVTSFLFVLAVFACIVLHELGHALTARRYGIRTRDITLLPIGGLARLERMPDDPSQELWVALAGPAVNVVIAAGLFVILAILGRLDQLLSGNLLQMKGSEFLENLMVTNLALVVFNLLPAFPMDGGRVLRALLAKRMEYMRATHLAASIGQAMAILLGIVGFMGIPGFIAPNPFLMFIALFVYLGAGQEAAMTETRRAMQGVPVRYAMMTRFQALTPDEPLRRAAEELVAGAQQDFPVVEGERVVGMLRREDLFRALHEHTDDAPVSSIMRRDCPVVSENDLLESVMRRMQSGECTSLAVVNGQRLVGLITLENIGEMMMLHRAREGHSNRTSAEGAI